MTPTLDLTIAGLPRRQRGRQSPAAESDYQQQVRAFCAAILQINSSLDFAIGSRDWCYLLEEYGLRKGDFDAAQKLINICRKSGDLPIDICAEDSTRETIGIEELDNANVEDEVDSWLDYLRDRAHENYTPVSFWDDLDVYVEMGVEKLGLRNLFDPVCKEFHVPNKNLKGWTDINSRAGMMERFAEHEQAGRQCVLLLCVDHDPGGLRISEKMRKNLEDLSGAVGWRPDNLIIKRFGLDADFIDRHGLTWIDNLETSKGLQLDDPDHNDHDKRYVQDYIAEFGVRKCEANALVAQPELGRALCRNAILEYVPEDALAQYERKLERQRKKLRTAIRRRLNGGARRTRRPPPEEVARSKPFTGASLMAGRWLAPLT